MRGQRCSFRKDCGSLRHDLWPTAHTPELRGQPGQGGQDPQVHSKGRPCLRHPHSSSEVDLTSTRSPPLPQWKRDPVSRNVLTLPRRRGAPCRPGSSVVPLAGAPFRVRPPGEHVGVERGAAHCPGRVTGTQRTQAEWQL